MNLCHGSHRAEPCGLSRNSLRFTAAALLNLFLFACDGEIQAVQLNASAVALSQDRGGDRVQEKIDRIVENGSKSPVPPQTTVLTEDEVNHMMRVQMKEFIPKGLSDPHLRLIGNNALLARAIVDLDEYKRRRPQRGGLDPLNLLSGRLPVTARGVLHTREGQGQVKLQAAEVNGIPLPPLLVREMITVLSRSPRQPNGYDIEQPFTLPAKIRTVTVHASEAVVTQ
jgi:hypothetical protein